MEITIHEEQISHFTFQGKKRVDHEQGITSHKKTLYHPLHRIRSGGEGVSKKICGTVRLSV